MDSAGLGIPNVSFKGICLGSGGMSGMLRAIHTSIG